MIKKIIILSIICILVGCASKSERLKKEYEIVSRKIEGLQNEQKAVVNAQVAADEYSKALDVYAKKVEQLNEVRNANDSNDLPVGPREKVVTDPKVAIQNLESHYNILSSKLEQLKEERKNIVNQQVALEKE